MQGTIPVLRLRPPPSSSPLAHHSSELSNALSTGYKSLGVLYASGRRHNGGRNVTSYNVDAGDVADEKRARARQPCARECRGPVPATLPGHPGKRGAGRPTAVSGRAEPQAERTRCTRRGYAQRCGRAAQVCTARGCVSGSACFKRVLTDCKRGARP